MANKVIKTRMVQKHDTSENWAKATNFAPLLGEIIVYDDLNKFKIGDGKSNVNDLPFANGEDLNIEKGSGNASLQQTLDGASTIDFTGKNPALTADNVATYFGEGADITKLPKGGLGAFSSSFGGKSIAKGKRSHAEGTTTIAIGAYSHSEGDNSVALGDDSHAEGYQTAAKGAVSHSEGSGTIASGSVSHAEGESTTASGKDSHTEGLSTTASGNYSHAEGNSSNASGNTSHAEGVNTAANGDGAHTEGYKTKASGVYSHAEGEGTIASGQASHSEGNGTEATSFRSHAEGSNTKTGDLVDLTVTPSEPDIPSGGGSSSGGSGSGSSGGTTEVTITKGASHSEGYRTSAYGWGSHSEGGSTVAYHHYSHAEGTRSNAYGEGSHAEGEFTETGDKTDLTKGLAAHSEGSYSKATGKYAHAEGRETVASGEGAHAEGGQTTANGLYAHSQNKNTTASGDYSSAIGDGCTASGASSFAGGYNSHAVGDNSFAFGENSYAGAPNTIALLGGQTNASKKFAVGDCLWVDSIDNLHTKGEVNRLCSIDKTSDSWYKFATLNFREHTGGSMLLNIKQSYVSEKYNVLIELAVTTVQNGFHEEDGIVFRQIAGKNICDKVGYYKDDSNVIHFVIKKGTYEKISMVALSDNFESGHLTFHSNYNTLMPPSIVYLDDSLLPPTKSEIDTKVANTFKYKGTFISPMVIPKTGFAPGDVYNCAWGGYIPNYFYNSKEITSIVFNEPTATSNLSLTVTFSEPIGTPEGSDYYISPYRIGLQLEGNPAGALIGTVNWNADGSFKDQTTITVTPTLQDEGHDEKTPNIRPFNDFMSYILSHTGPFNTTVFNVKEYIGSTGVSCMYVDDGCDVVYTGDAWDSLGSNFNPNNYYTTSQVDNKIAASGGTGDPNTVIISSAADFSTTQTFANKTIKIAADIDLPANSTITFNNCIIHGLSKNINITTYGDNLTFTNCNIYDLTILGYGDSSTSSLNVKLTLTNCKLNNCSVYGSALRSSFLSDCTFINSSYSTPATGDIYFSGNTTFIGGSITQTNDNGSLMLVKNSRTFINGTSINMEITGATLFKNEMTGHTSSLSLIGCYEKNNKTINIGTDITTTPVLATLKTLNFTPITQTQE